MQLMFIYSGLFYTNEKEIKYVYTYKKGFLEMNSQ